MRGSAVELLAAIVAFCALLCLQSFRDCSCFTASNKNLYLFFSVKHRCKKKIQKKHLWLPAVPVVASLFALLRAQEQSVSLLPCVKHRWKKRNKRSSCEYLLLCLLCELSLSLSFLALTFAAGIVIEVAKFRGMRACSSDFWSSCFFCWFSCLFFPGCLHFWTLCAVSVLELSFYLDFCFFQEMKKGCRKVLFLLCCWGIFLCRPSCCRDLDSKPGDIWICVLSFAVASYCRFEKNLEEEAINRDANSNDKACCWAILLLSEEYDDENKWKEPDGVSRRNVVAACW